MRTFSMIVFIAVVVVALTNAAVDFRQVAHTSDKIDGQEIASFGRYVSINDSGQVAFKAKFVNGSEAIIRADPNLTSGAYNLSNPDLTTVIDTADGTRIFFGDYVNINSNGSVSYRRKVTSPEFVFSIKRDKIQIAHTLRQSHRWFASLLSPTDINSNGAGDVSFFAVVADDMYRPIEQIRKGNGSSSNEFLGEIVDTTLIASEPDFAFTSFNKYTSINDDGRVVFTGRRSTLGEGIFVGEGVDSQTPSTIDTVASSTSGFDVLGKRPSINNNGNVAFYGLKATGEEGIYIWSNLPTPDLRVSVSDLVIAVDRDSRVAFNDQCAVAFTGTANADAGPVRALFRDAGFGAEVIMKAGDEIAGGPAIDSIELWDGMNIRGEVVVWTHHVDSSESIIATTGITQYAGCPQPPGRVAFADINATPINGAEVWAYTIGQGTDIALIGQPSWTDEHGRFYPPGAFSDPLHQSSRLGLLARIGYWDPGTGDYHTIINYPNNNPFPARGAIKGDETILFPLPTVLVPGLWGGTSTWEIFTDYLTADPAAVSAKHAGPQKVPAFLTFTMPSQQKDGQTWGYDNGSPWSHIQHNINVGLLHLFLNRDDDTGVRGSLRDVVLDPELRKRLPIHLCAHSMGAIFTRGWLHITTRGIPPVQRYVSFDGVHGGTSTFLGVGRYMGGFAEWRMNGYNSTPLQPPTDPGWNYLHPVSTSGNNLLLSASCLYCLVVTPNCSALGVGRTMSGVQSSYPNGHQGRFIGGFEWHTDKGHKSIHDDSNILEKVTRYLAHGVPPTGTTVSGTAYDCDNFPSIPLLAQSQMLGVPGEYTGTILAGPQQVAEAVLQIDGNTSISVSALIENSQGTIDLLDSTGTSIIPPDPQIIEIEDARSIAFTIDAPPAGQVTFRLTADDEPVAAYFNISFENQRALVVEVPIEPLLPQTPVPILASVRDGTGEVIVGSGGTMEIIVTLPDQNTVEMELFDDGAHGDGLATDGVYGNQFTFTNLGGRYLVNGHCQVGFGDEIIERTAIDMFIVNSFPVSLVGIIEERPVDETGNGKYDWLEFDFDVQVDNSGQYQLRAFLHDASQEMIAENHVLFEESTGTHTVTLRFDSAALVGHGVDGPWTVTQIELFDYNQVLLADTLPDWTTQLYLLSQFEPPPPPVVTQVLPNYGSVVGGNEVVLQGGYLEHISGIAIGEVKVDEFEVLSDLSIRLTLPHGQSCEAVAIELETPWTTEVFSNAYTYIPCSGDFDTDCDVDFLDLAVMSKQWMKEGPDLTADISPANGDEVVNLLDLAEFAFHWLQTTETE